MPLDLKERRQGYMKKAQDKARETNVIRGMLSFVSRKTKKTTYKNKLIDELLSNGIYKTIWDKYQVYLDDTEDDGDDNEKIFDYLNEKEFDIIALFDFVVPEELGSKREGSFIQEIPINL
jgi:hypothetical protein